MGRRRASTNGLTWEFARTPEALQDVVNAASQASAYGLDTEFHRQTTYYPELALVQLAWADRLVLVDPLEVSMEPLAELLNSDALTVIHGAQQDLEVLQQSCGAQPRHLFDTQIAAGFLGMSSPSLARLHNDLLDMELPKAARMSDWLARPLSKAQLRYAAADVANLLEIRDILESRLKEKGRMEWAQQEFQVLLEQARSGRKPEEAWHRLKELRGLKSDALALGCRIAEWREKHAARVNQPVRHLMSDITVANAAVRPPKNLVQLRKLRGMEKHHLSAGADQQLLEFIAALRKSQLGPPPETRTLDPKLKPAVGLIASWVAQYANDIELDPALLATRGDVESMLRGDPDCRILRHPWRKRLVGEPIEQLISGEASIAFNSGLPTMEERSRQPMQIAK